MVFNLAPVRYVHPSWYDAAEGGEGMRALAGAPALQRAISATLLERFGLDRAFATEFSEPRARLALLDRPLLESLLLYVGAALRSDALRAVLDGRRLAYLRREIGSGALDYAIRRAPLSGPIPAFALEPSEESMRVTLLRIGAAFSLSPEAVGDPAYLRRVGLMLPRRAGVALAEDLPHPDAPEGRALPPLVRRILKEFSPLWLPFFD